MPGGLGMASNEAVNLTDRLFLLGTFQIYDRYQPATFLGGEFTWTRVYPNMDVKLLYFLTSIG